MNKKLLRSEMAKFGDTNESLAKYLDIAPSTLSLKMNDNEAEFRQKEISAIKSRYSLDAEQIEAIFFSC